MARRSNVLAAAGAALLLASPARAAIESLGLGTNLGNTLEAPVEGAWQDHFASQQFFVDQAAAGFKTVRIPVRWDQHMAEAPPYAVNASFMARVQQVAGWCLETGMYCIVNSHWDTWLDTNDTVKFNELLPRYAAIWAQVAVAFEGAPEALIFEAFNEPEHFTIPCMNAMLDAFYRALRPLHPTRTLVLGWLNGMGESFIVENNRTNWDAMVYNASDPNLVVEVHSYDPWDVCGDPTQPYTPVDRLNMMYLFGNLSEWSRDHGTRLFIGEGGCVKTQADRLPWYRDFYSMCRQGVQGGPGLWGCLVWDDEGDFIIYNRTARTFDQSVLSAMGL